MFGMGGSEIIVILIVALLFLGPDKLPSAAKSISKGIRGIKQQSRALQQQIESDEQIGGAIRDLKSALRGEELPVQRSIRPPPKRALDADKSSEVSGSITGSITGPGALNAGEPPTLAEVPPLSDVPPLSAPESKGVTLPATAGEPDVDLASGEPGASDGDAELASLIKPASGTVAKGS